MRTKTNKKKKREIDHNFFKYYIIVKFKKKSHIC